MPERSDVFSRNPSYVQRAGDQSPVAAGFLHPLQILPGEYATPGKQPDGGMPAAERLEQAQINPGSGSDPTQIQHQNCAHAHGGRLTRKGHGIRLRRAPVGHQRMKNRRAEVQVEAENDAIRPSCLHDFSQVTERAKRFEPDDCVRGTGRQNLQRTVRIRGGCVHHQLSREAGLEFDEVVDQASLDRPALDSIEIGEVTGLRPQDVAVGTGKRQGITGLIGCEHRFHRSEVLPDAPLCVHGHSHGHIQNRNDFHASPAG